MLQDPKFRKKLLFLAIDEAHCAFHFGDKFRPEYRQLSSLRARIPDSVPVLAVSATLMHNHIKEIKSFLSILESRFKFIQVGNDRSNVSIIIQTLKNPVSSFKDLSFLIPKNITTVTDIPKTIVYIDRVMDVVDAIIYLYTCLPEPFNMQPIILPVHAIMAQETRNKAMQQLLNSTARILVCTEAAGMVRVLNSSLSIPIDY